MDDRLDDGVLHVELAIGVVVPLTQVAEASSDAVRGGERVALVAHHVDDGGRAFAPLEPRNHGLMGRVR